MDKLCYSVDPISRIGDTYQTREQTGGPSVAGSIIEQEFHIAVVKVLPQDVERPSNDGSFGRAHMYHVVEVGPVHTSSIWGSAYYRTKDNVEGRPSAGPACWVRAAVRKYAKGDVPCRVTKMID